MYNYKISTNTLILMLVCVLSFSAVAQAETIEKKLTVREINTKGSWVGCTPAAVLNIMGYWADQGFDIFGGLGTTTSSNVSESQVNLMLADLEYEMGTSESGTTVGPYAIPGAKKVLMKKKVKGCYEFDIQVLWNVMPAQDYEKILLEIDSGRPVILAGGMNPGSVFALHSACVSGYSYDTDTWSLDYSLSVVDGWDTTSSPVEQGWTMIPAIPFPFTPNAAFMVSFDMQKPDNPACPCGIWEVMYKFNGENEKEWPANFSVYGDETYKTEDLGASYSGTWTTSVATGSDRQISFTILLDDKPAALYQATFDGENHLIEDGTIFIHSTGLRGTWYGSRYSDDPWETPPELENPYEQSNSFFSAASIVGE
jgi:hypothetical protein